jgi:hypothetical protein
MRSIVFGSAATLLLLGACAADRQPRLLDETLTPPFTPIPDASSDVKAVPRCSVPTREVCDCAELPLGGVPPNIYFVLDHSGSMQRDNLWGTVSTVTLDVVRRIGSRANFGAAMFPGANGNACTTGVEVMSTRPGDSPGSYGPVLKYLSERTIAIPPGGGTPTAATLAKLKGTLEQLKGKTFVVLATDGGPNCSSTTTCDASKCQANIEGYASCTPAGPSCCDGITEGCLDDTATITQVKALQALGISTYVLGVPGSDPYTSLLNTLAVEGGTARTGTEKYFRVDSTDKLAFAKAMSQVAAKIVATCTIDLKDAPPDIDKVNVYLDEAALTKEPVNGWKLEGKTVTLLGTACDSVLAGDVLDVRVIAGCKTIAPK